MYTEKALELARDIAREQYTDDPDDPHWWEDEGEDEDADEDEPLTIEDKRQFLIKCGYPKRAIDMIDDEEVLQWYDDEIKEQQEQEYDDTPRNPSERYPGVVTYPYS